MSTGCSDRQNTWEPVGNLQGALVLKLVEFFDEQYPRADQRAKPIYMKGGLGMRREIERRAEQARDERAAEGQRVLDLRDDGLEAPDVDDAAILAQLGQEEQKVHDGNDLQELFGELTDLRAGASPKPKTSQRELVDRLPEILKRMWLNESTRTLYPHVLCLMVIAVVLPMTTGGFSRLKLLKSRLRSKMETTLLDAFMRVCYKDRHKRQMCLSSSGMLFLKTSTTAKGAV